MKKIKWFWSHQRNMTLLQIELVAKGFRSKGYHPKLRFDFDNQLFVFHPDKGFYLFYDKDLMKKKMLQLQEDIQMHEDELIDYFHLKTNQFFGHLLMVGRDVANTNLELVDNNQLKKFFIDFKEAITIAPIITIQLWGIESCWLEEGPLAKWLKGKVGKEFDKYRQELSATTGKTVAYAEREEFLSFLASIPLDFNWEEFIGSKHESMLRKHMQKYGWITAEYKSKPWNFEKWVEVAKENHKDASKNLKKQVEEFEENFGNKRELLQKLNPPMEVRKVIKFLDACNIQRDWSKGKYCEAYLYFRSLMEEIGKRLDLSFDELYALKTEEIEMALDTGHVDKRRIEERLKGHTFLIKKGIEEVYEKEEMSKVLESEGVLDFFIKEEQGIEAKGISACLGKATGKARVLDSSKRIKDFQEGEILITYMTTMEFTPLFSKAKAIVCDEGGVSSHAAIVSREFGIPCIVGAQNAMKIIKTGDLVEVDANKGIVRKLEVT